MVTIRKRKTTPMRNVPPTHAQLWGAPCVSTYERQSRSSTPVTSAMYGRESESCRSAGGFSSFQATVLRGKNSAGIDGNILRAEAGQQRGSVIDLRLRSSVFGLLTDLRPDPAEAPADVRAPI